MAWGKFKFDGSDPVDNFLIDLRGFIHEHNLSADQAEDMFRVGFRASSIFGNGTILPSLSDREQECADGLAAASALSQRGGCMDAALEERIAKFEADLARAARIAKQRADELREFLEEVSATLSPG